jgi:hypothetical protein
MKKIVLSGSLHFHQELDELANQLINNGYDVLNYPKPTDNLKMEFPALFTRFYQSIEEADIFYLYNPEKNGVPGYIGAAGFAEATYALCRKLLHQQSIAIILAEQPSEAVACFEEINQWIQNNWITIGADLY